MQVSFESWSSAHMDKSYVILLPSRNCAKITLLRFERKWMGAQWNRSHMAESHDSCLDMLRRIHEPPPSREYLTIRGTATATASDTRFLLVL
jgi:hypothetical protein